MFEKRNKTSFAVHGIWYGTMILQLSLKKFWPRPFIQFKKKNYLENQHTRKLNGWNKISNET